jgi:O-antigen/teichoic acid export membrane protein
LPKLLGYMWLCGTDRSKGCRGDQTVSLQMVSILTGRRFTQHVGVTLITQVAGLLFSIANAAIIARWLGPEGKGIVTLTFLVPGMLGVFLSGGIGVANVYFAGSQRLDVPTLTANTVDFALLATLLGTGVVGILVATGWLASLVPGIPIGFILLAMLGLPFEVFKSNFSTILLGLQRIVTVNLVNLVSKTLGLAFTALLVVEFQSGVPGALAASLGAGVVSLILFTIFLRREGAVFLPRWDRSVMKSTLAFGLKGHVGNVLQFFNYRLDMFLVNLFLGPAGVGIYSASVSLAELLWYLPNAVGFVILPKAAASKPEVMNAFTPRVFQITLGLTALGGLGLSLVGKFLIRFIYSPAFIGAYIPMLILLPGVVLLGGAKVLTNEIAGRGYPHYNSINAGLSLILTVVLDLALIPRFGVVGAALASSFAYTAIFFAAIGFYYTVNPAAIEIISGKFPLGNLRMARLRALEGELRCLSDNPAKIRLIGKKGIRVLRRV